MPPFQLKQPRERRRKYWRAPMKRARLKMQSEKKSKWNKLYYLGLRFLISLDPLCRRCRSRRASEGHHPFGQIGALILLFWPFCRTCHVEVHDHPNTAREEGWLLT